MSALAPTLQAFFTERLTRQRQASPHTIAAYRDAWKLLLTFAAQRTGKRPSQLDIADLDADLIAEFLDHLQHERGNSVTTRNARLAAIRSLFRVPRGIVGWSVDRGCWERRRDELRPLQTRS